MSAPKLLRYMARFIVGVVILVTIGTIATRL